MRRERVKREAKLPCQGINFTHYGTHLELFAVRYQCYDCCICFVVCVVHVLAL